MEDLFKEIEQGINVELYQLTLGTTLCLPDICAALESSDGRTSGKKYKDWYKRYVGNKFMMTADDCYFLRCSFLHQGSTFHKNSQFEKILFTEPNSIVFHNNIINDALNVDISVFCKEIVESAREWLEYIKDDDNFIRNHEKTFKKHPNGVQPYMTGMPVYA